MNSSYSILYIKNDKHSCELLEFLFENEDFKVLSCAASENGLHPAKQGRFSAIVLDHRLVHISGVEICREIRSYDKRKPNIFFTASAFAEEREAGMAAGANDCPLKPDGFEPTTETIKRLVA